MSSPSECLQTEFIPVTKVLSLRPIVADYLQGSPSVQEYISAFQSLDHIPSLIQNKKDNYQLRQITYEVLVKQYQTLTLTDEQKNNLSLFQRDTTFCITTAHQTNLFGGPLYFIQKAVSVIKACQLAKESVPNYDFVPVYWLGSEDHDFEELNHIYVNGETIEWDDHQGGAFGRYNPKSLTPQITQLGELLGQSNGAKELLSLIKDAYEKHHSIAQATRYLLHQILGEYGLLVIDGDNHVLKREMIPIFRKELTDQFSSKASEVTISSIESKYGKTQAHAREINLFYLSESGRHRIVAQPYGYSIHGTKLQFSEAKMLQELEEFPERFSPNVMLRPLMQEMILPNLMYVGGGGESTYWFQLKGIFDAASVAFPMIALRDSAVYLSRKTIKRMNQAKLTLDDLFQPKETLIKSLVQQQTNHSLHLNEAKQLLQKAIQDMGEKAEQIDFTLRASAKAEEQRIINAIANLEKKMMRAEKKNHKQLITWIDEIYDAVYPKNALQERKENFTQYLLEYGNEWIHWMLKNFNLFDQQVKVMKQMDC